MKTLKNNMLVDALKDIVIILLGCFIFAISINCFTDPNDICPGGVIGVAQLLHDIKGFNVTMVGWLINTPIFIWAFIEYDWKRLIKNAFATLMLYPMIDLTRAILPEYTNNMMIAAILGGVFGGIGLALIFMRGAATGGTDLLAALTKEHIKHLPVGKILLGIDGTVVMVSAIIYSFTKNDPYGVIEGATYAAILLFIQTKIIDAILFGTSPGNGKLMMIFSKKNPEISQKIMSDLNRGATTLMSRGEYTKEEGEVLISAMKKADIPKAYEIIRDIDEKAFIVVGDAGEITGLGFKEIEKSNKKKKKK